ncbi:hypothetical protein [Hyphomicrobium sp.]|uniref:hypothetical protein n=1 Tax=Hyphomicrobium sp. TaxID=82 RepID=UPI003F6FCEA4
MVYAPAAGRSRGLFARSFKLGLLPDASGDEPDSGSPRDLKKLILIVGLGTLSWVATYVGMLELIQANMGDLPLIHKLIVGFSVAMLMTMIVWLLDQMFSSSIGFGTRLAYIAGYLFLSLISVGFGFGFYWKVLESRSESSRSAELAVTGVQTSLNVGSTRLEQLNATLVQVADLSRRKAETERDKGTSCPNSKPGDGPRRRMRDDDAQRFGFASEFVAGRVGAVKTSMGALDGDLAKIASNDPSIIDPKSGVRNEFMKQLGRKLDMTVSGFNALRTDPQLQQLRQDLVDRADKTTFGDPKSGGFSCPDAELAQALRGAARAIAELPVLETPKIAAVEGSEATIEAFRRLTTTFYGALSFKLPPSADELRELQKKAIRSVENGGSTPPPPTDGGGLSQRDYVPLAVAIFVDICLLLVSIGGRGHRLHGLMPKMREAERGPVIEILSRFNDIHRDPEIRESFELFRHVVFDVHGSYYVAVPLDAPPDVSAAEREDLRTEAQLLANLFTSFEKDRIFKRTWTPFNGAVRKKLAKQGSKFAGSEAFRIYKFRDGAWSEFILGAVMGAARRAEADANRRRIERDILRRSEPMIRMEPRLQTETRTRSEKSARTEPSVRTDPSVRNSQSFGAADPVFGSSSSHPRKTRIEPEWTSADERKPATAAEASAETWQTPHFRYAPPASAQTAGGFGPYARSAAAELGASPDAEDATSAPANSNTAPHRRAGETAGPASSAGAPVAEIETESPSHSAVEGILKSCILEPAVLHADRVDVVLKRETATVSLPFGRPEDHGGLIGRLSEALTAIDTPDEKNSPAPGAAVIDISAIAPFDFGTRMPSQDLKLLEQVADDNEGEISNDDAATMASRLRPAFRNG